MFNQKAHYEKLTVDFDLIWWNFVGKVLTKAEVKVGLDKVTVQLDLLNCKAELYKMTAQLDQLGGPIGEEPGPIQPDRNVGLVPLVILVV